MCRALYIALTAVLAAGPFHAAQGIEARVTLGASAMRVDATTEVTGRTRLMGREFLYDESFDFGSDEVIPRFDAEIRIGHRHRAMLNYFDYDEQMSTTLRSAIVTGTGIIPPGSPTTADVDLRLGGAVYDFALVEGDMTSVGLQIGAQHVRLQGALSAQAGATTYAASRGEEGVLPVVGARLAFTPHDRWRVVAQVQHFDSDWADLDGASGELTRAQVRLEYRAHKYVGAHVGYDYLAFDVRNPESEGLVSMDQRFRGPVVGLMLAF